MGMVKSQKVFAKFTCPKRLSVEISYGLVRFIAVNQKPMPAMGTLAPDGTATGGKTVQTAIRVTVSRADVKSPHGS